MKLLTVARSYPHPGHPFSGVFNERCVKTLAPMCDQIEVLVPRPYVPPGLGRLNRRWKAYAHMVAEETRRGIPVYRPAHFQVPHLASSFWMDQGCFLSARGIARKMHARVRFDAILSFDLIGAGGLAWRLGRDLGIPASGWATGDDVRVGPQSALGRIVSKAMKHLDLVFYQSFELLRESSAWRDGGEANGERHVVLPRGIPGPPALPAGTRRRVRAAWNVRDNQIVVLYIGRMVREKGIFDLLAAASRAAAVNPCVQWVLVGAQPGFDDTQEVIRAIDQHSELKKCVNLFPVCPPDQIWESLCAADVFAFASHQEGMPNSLLEAMAMGVPSVSYAIPPAVEVDAGVGGLALVPPLDTDRFAESVLLLAASHEDRLRIGKSGRGIIEARFMMEANMAEAYRHLTRMVQHRRKVSRGWLPALQWNRR